MGVASKAARPVLVATGQSRMTTLAYILAIAAGLVIFAAVIGIAICSHFDGGYFDGDDEVHP